MSSIVALEWLLQHSNDENLNVPLTGEQLWQIAERHARNPFRADPTVCLAVGPAHGPTKALTPWALVLGWGHGQALRFLTDMGFNRFDVIEALRVTHNDQNAACAFLLGVRDRTKGHGRGAWRARSSG